MPMLVMWESFPSGATVGATHASAWTYEDVARAVVPSASKRAAGSGTGHDGFTPLLHVCDAGADGAGYRRRSGRGGLAAQERTGRRRLPEDRYPGDTAGTRSMGRAR